VLLGPARTTGGGHRRRSDCERGGA